MTPIPALKDPFFDEKKTDKDDPLLWKLEMKKEKHVRPRPEYVPINSLPHSKPRFKHSKANVS